MDNNLFNTLRFAYIEGDITHIESVKRPELYEWRQFPYWVFAFAEIISGKPGHLETPRDGKVRLATNHISCIPPHIPHQFTPRPGLVGKSTWCHVKFNLDFGLDIASFLQIPLILGGKVALKLKEIIEELVAVDKNQSLSPLLKSISQTKLGVSLLETILPYGKTTSTVSLTNKDTPRIFKVLHYIDTHLTSNLKVQTLAAQIHLSPPQLHRIFKEVMGTGPMEFVRNARMTKACEMLMSTQLAVSEISAKVGYPNQYIFSRAFKNHVGISPLNFRNHTPYYRLKKH